MEDLIEEISQLFQEFGLEISAVFSIHNQAKADCYVLPICKEHALVFEKDLDTLYYACYDGTLDLKHINCSIVWPINEKEGISCKWPKTHSFGDEINELGLKITLKQIANILNGNLKQK